MNVPSNGTVVGVQTACIVVKAGEGLNNSLYLATKDTSDGKKAAGTRQSVTARLAFCPDRDTESIFALTNDDAMGKSLLSKSGNEDEAPEETPTLNPQLFYPFNCLVREEDPESTVIGAKNAAYVPRDAGGSTPPQQASRRQSVVQRERRGSVVGNSSAPTTENVNNDSLTRQSSQGEHSAGTLSRQQSHTGDKDSAPPEKVQRSNSKSGVFTRPRAKSIALTIPQSAFKPEDYQMPPEEAKERIMAQTIATQVIDGINSSVIAIGGSGTGKTMRMLHPGDGLLSRVVDGIFAHVKDLNAKDEAAYRHVNRTVTVSILELFAEECSDLLSIPKRKDGGDLDVGGNFTKSGRFDAAPAGTTVDDLENDDDDDDDDGEDAGAVGANFAAVAQTGPADETKPEGEGESKPANAEGEGETKTSGTPRGAKSVQFKDEPTEEAAKGDKSESKGPSRRSSKAQDYEDADEEDARFNRDVLRRYIGGQSVAPTNTGLRLRVHPEFGAICEGAQELQILSREDFLNVARGAIARRFSHQVKSNRYSHVVFKLTIRQAEVGAAAAKTSTFTFTDTASAMRVPSSIPRAKRVQQSTNALRRMLQMLSDHCMSNAQQVVSQDQSGEPQRADDIEVQTLSKNLRAELGQNAALGPLHPSDAGVPNPGVNNISMLPKDSILTQMLQDSFFGNCFTTVIACVLDPQSIGDVGSSAMEEEGANQTLTTLKLVSRAAAIATRVSQNYVPVQATAGAIREEIEALKRQMADQKKQGGNQLEELQQQTQSKLQSYEEKLANVQSTFEEKQASQADLEAKCQRQRDALANVQTQLESKRQAADDLEKFASEIDDLMEEHRAHEAKIRAAEEEVRQREAEAAKVQKELSNLAEQEQKLSAETEEMDRRKQDQRQRQIASFFKQVAEQGKRARDISTLEAANRQLKIRCAQQQAKKEKNLRAQPKLRDDVAALREVYDAQKMKEQELETDESVPLATQQVEQLEDVTAKQQESKKTMEEDLAMHTKGKADEEAAIREEKEAAAPQLKKEDEKVTELVNERAELKIQTDERDLNLATRQSDNRDLEERVQDLRKDIEELEQRLRELDDEKQTLIDASTKLVQEAEDAEEQLVSVAEEANTQSTELAQRKKVLHRVRTAYFDLCNSASGRLANAKSV